MIKPKCSEFKHAPDFSSFPIIALIVFHGSQHDNLTRLRTVGIPLLYPFKLSAGSIELALWSNNLRLTSVAITIIQYSKGTMMASAFKNTQSSHIFRTPLLEYTNSHGCKGLCRNSNLLLPYHIVVIMVSYGEILAMFPMAFLRGIPAWSLIQYTWAGQFGDRCSTHDLRTFQGACLISLDTTEVFGQECCFPFAIGLSLTWSYDFFSC